MSRFYISTPIYYVNDYPHIGHIYTTLVADTVARYRRLQGDDVYFSTGTDEHGQNIIRAATKEGIQPIELADRVVSRYHDLWAKLGISHSDFIRTTEPRHAASVHRIIEKIEAQGDFYVDRHEGWYCASCENFYTEKELSEKKECPVHEKKAEWQAEENIFFRLSKYQDRLLAWYDANPNCVRPQSRFNEVRSFVDGGLRDLSVSRSNLPWGVSFPGYEGQTVYVWLDALTNYLSTLGFGESEDSPKYQDYWVEDGAERIHLMGKDILRFHAVFWPAFLMAAGLPLPDTIWAHGWWLQDQKKMSKSTGNVVRPGHLIERFGTDPLRFFLLREMSFGQDASFSDEAFIDRYNSDLANGLGNTTSRLIALSRKNFHNRVPPKGEADDLREAAEDAVKGFTEHMGQYAFHRALEHLWRLISETNQYLVQNEPWKMGKNPELRDRMGEVLWNGLESVRLVATALQSILPEIAPKLLRQIGASEKLQGEKALQWGGLESGADIPQSDALFPRIDKKKYLAELAAEAEAEAAAEAAARDNLISIDQFFETELKVATVKEAIRVPKSDKLLQLTVDAGEGGSRTIVAGIGKAYGPEELVGTQVLIVANLKPAKLMGITSEGMVLAATGKDGQPHLIRPESAVPSGTRVG